MASGSRKQRAIRVSKLRPTRPAAQVIGRFSGETSALALIWAVLEFSSRGWRGVVMTPRAVAEIEQLRRSPATDETNMPSTEEVVAA